MAKQHDSKSTRPNLDVAGGDIAKGDYIQIKSWVGNSAALKPTQVGPLMTFRRHTDSEDGESLPNEALLQDLLYVVDRDADRLLVQSMDLQGRIGFLLVRCAEIEYTKPTPEFVESFLKSHETIYALRSGYRWWHRLLGLKFPFRAPWRPKTR